MINHCGIDDTLQPEKVSDERKVSINYNYWINSHGSSIHPYLFTDSHKFTHFIYMTDVTYQDERITYNYIWKIRIRNVVCPEFRSYNCKPICNDTVIREHLVLAESRSDRQDYIKKNIKNRSEYKYPWWFRHLFFRSFTYSPFLFTKRETLCIGMLKMHTRISCYTVC